MEQDIAVGLDIGTTKVCAIVASPDDNYPGKLKILGIGKSTSEGLTRGVVTNIEKTVRSIQSAVQDAEQQSGVKISSVTVGIAGDHIQSFQSRGVISISRPENEITQEDIDRLIEDTKRVALPLDRKIIHVIPQQFIVDGQDSIYDPVGMSGVRMEAIVHIITGLVTAAQNIYKCVQRAGLHVNDMVLEPLASSYAVLDDEEKDVLESYDRDDWRPVKNPKKEIKKLKEYARKTLQKDKRINIRISSKDLAVPIQVT